MARGRLNGDFTNTRTRRIKNAAHRCVPTQLLHLYLNLATRTNGCTGERWPMSIQFVIIFIFWTNNKLKMGNLFIYSHFFLFLSLSFPIWSGQTASPFRSESALSLGQWHTIKVSRTARLAVIKVSTRDEIFVFVNIAMNDDDRNTDDDDDDDHDYCSDRGWQ